MGAKFMIQEMLEGLDMASRNDYGFMLRSHCFLRRFAFFDRDWQL
jgi:hypothetical protein